MGVPEGSEMEPPRATQRSGSDLSRGDKQRLAESSHPVYVAALFLKPGGPLTEGGGCAAAALSRGDPAACDGVAGPEGVTLRRLLRQRWSCLWVGSKKAELVRRPGWRLRRQGRVGGMGESGQRTDKGWWGWTQGKAPCLSAPRGSQAARAAGQGACLPVGGSPASAACGPRAAPSRLWEESPRGPARALPWC